MQVVVLIPWIQYRYTGPRTLETATSPSKTHFRNTWKILEIASPGVSCTSPSIAPIGRDISSNQYLVAAVGSVSVSVSELTMARCDFQ